MKTIHTYTMPDHVDDDGGGDNHIGLQVSVVHGNFLGRETHLLLIESQCPSVWLHGLLQLRRKCPIVEDALFGLTQVIAQTHSYSYDNSKPVHVIIDDKARLSDESGTIKIVPGDRSLLAFPLHRDYISQAGFDKVCARIVKATHESAIPLMVLQALYHDEPDQTPKVEDPSTWWHPLHPLGQVILSWPKPCLYKLVAPEDFGSTNPRVEIFHDNVHIGHILLTGRESYDIHLPGYCEKPIACNLRRVNDLLDSMADLTQLPIR